MSDETRRRILNTAHALEYRTNTAAAELAARRSSRLAVIVPYPAFFMTWHPSSSTSLSCLSVCSSFCL